MGDQLTYWWGRKGRRGRMLPEMLTEPRPASSRTACRHPAQRLPTPTVNYTEPYAPAHTIACLHDQTYLTIG